jgi:glutamine amidotransferase
LPLIIDYGMGNLRSVQKAIERVGFDAPITDDADTVRKADKIVLPGVGAFADAINALHNRGLVDPIKESVGAGTPFLGICLGLQMLFDESFEDGRHRGLGILAGTVEKFEPAPPGRPRLKVPHMGWNQINIKSPAPILDGVPNGVHMYFVHSYYVKPSDPEVVATETEYGAPFTSMVWRDNVFATQFHPEKSQAYGLRMLANFCRM